MEDCSSTQPFSNHHHHHRPSFQLPLPQSPDLGYPSSQPALDPLEQYGNRGGKFSASFPTSSTSPGGRRPSNGEDRGLLNTSGSSLDGDANMGGHHDRESAIGSHFDDTWCGSIKKEDVWEHQESCERAGDNFCYNNANDVCHGVSCRNEEGVSHQLKANMNNYPHVSYGAGSETFYSKEANVSHLTKQTTSFNRSVTGSFSDSSGDYCRTDSRVSDNYLGREEDYGSSCGSGEDQLQSAEAEGPWINVSPSIQTRWRATDSHTYDGSQRAPIDVSRGTSTQKLDSFSEAFLSQRKRKFPLIPCGDSSGQMWEFGVGRGENPGFDSYIPPSCSSSPTHHPLVSFPSPPTSSHFMSSVLSPPPTPRPPPILSPSKMDSPGAFGGTGHSVSQGGDSLDVLQFFASHLQALPSIHSSGMIWKFPLLAHSFPQPSGDPDNIEGNLRSCHGVDFGSIAAPRNLLKSPESSFLTSVHPPSTLCPSNTPSPHASRPAHHYEAAVTTAPYMVTQRVKNGSGSLSQSQLQQQPSQIFTGTPFPSILHCCRNQKRGRYTPRPLLNPARRGMGLYSSLSSLHHREEETCGEEHEGFVFPYVNMGHDFQAELPQCFAGGDESGSWSSEEESPREQLLWKPLDELEESANLQDEVEKLLSMCSSSCLPGGGSNIELALHCLHHCQGSTLATLDMLLFTQPLPTGGYHYSGSDFWTDSEKVLFNAALGTYGKELSLIQKMVRTKTTSQCVEFFYLSKKLQDKQKKQKEKNRDGEMELQKSIIPAGGTMNRQFGLEVAVPVPSLASFFPCKLCGKMFYKIKSRNAHMKIHRQTQEDWTDRHHQLLTQRLGGNLLPPQAPARTFSSSGLPGTAINNSTAVLNSVNNNNTFAPSNSNVLDPNSLVTYGNIAMSNSHLITTIDGDDSNRREATTVLPFNQLWGSFGRGPDPATFSCNTEQKDEVRARMVGGNEPIHWQ